MTSRERIRTALDHGTPDRIPCDFGGCSVTGMHVSVVYALRQALKLDPPGTPVKVIDPFQMLGELETDLLDVLDVDTVALSGTGTFFGFKKEGWKPWKTFDGTPVLVPGGFNTEPSADGSILLYPYGDRSAKASGMMPQGGFYFDALQRAETPDFDNLLVDDNVEEFCLLTEDELAHLARESARLRRETDRAIFGAHPGSGFGDMAWLPGPALKTPKGVRAYDEWLTSLVTRPDFVHAVFERQCEIAMENLVRLHRAVGDGIDVLFVTGADFGSQHAPTISPELYAELFLPYYRRVNTWVHENTSWATFMHSCGAVASLVPLFIEAGFDALNPVQCSAAGMDPRDLKRNYGKQIAFWGGAVDTQSALPFGTPDEVRAQVRARMEILGEGGGFVFSTVHNIQPGTPTENLLSLFDTYRAHREYNA